MGNGAYGMSIGEQGYSNGSFFAFLIYSAVSISVFFLLKSKIPGKEHSFYVSPIQFNRYSFRVLFLLLSLVLVMLLGFGAYRVWFGEIGKGEFRAGLGPFGFFAYLTTKYIAPLALAYAAFLYKHSDRRLWEKSLLIILLLAGLLLGSTWGFKSTGLTIVLPSLVILLWSSGIMRLAGFAAISLFVILIFSFIFDGSKSLVSALSFIFIRVTVLQGDVAWYVWGLYQAGVDFPPYSQTLAAALSDTFLKNALNLDKENYSQWVLFHYDLLLNKVAGLPISATKAGHTIVGTPFSEGLIMGGLVGVFFMAILSGVLAGFVYNQINKNLVKGRGMIAAIWATYFCVFLFPWLRGGAVVQLFHVGLVVSFFISFVFVFLMANLVLRVNRRV